MRVPATGLEQIAINMPALEAAIKSKAKDVIGLAAGGPSYPLTLFTQNTYDHALAQDLARQHDPVFLSVNKSIVIADGIDTITISVYAPKSTAVPIMLQVVGPNGLSQSLTVPMIGVTGSVIFTTLIRGNYILTMVNGYNRNVDVNTLVAT